MKKILCFIFVFFFGMLPTYALTFNVKGTLDKKEIKAGDSVKLSLEVIDIKEASVGISSCEMNVVLSDGISMTSDYILGNPNWKSEKGTDKVMFILMNDYLENIKLFSVDLKVNKSGSISFSNIKCFELADDGIENSYEIESRKVDINISSSKSSSSSKVVEAASSSSSSSYQKVEKVFLKGFKLKDGTITVEDEKYSYSLKVDSLDNIEITPILGEGMTYTTNEFSVDDNGYGYEFVVSDSTGETKRYKVMFFLDEKNPSSSNSSLIETTGEKSDYSIYFIAVIVILIGINVFRIISNKKKVLE